MADEDIDISVTVDTGTSAADLDDVRDSSREAGEALDQLDGESASIDIDTKGAADGLDDVRRKSDGARDSLGSTGGEGVAQLGELAGATGPVSEGLAQITEGALNGQLNLKNLAGAGAGLAALQLLMFAIGQRAKNAAERIKEISSATEELSRVADDEVITELGRAMANAALSGQSMDDTLRKMATDNLPGFRRAVELAGTDSRVTATDLEQMRAALADVEAEMAQQEETSRRYGDNLDDVATGAGDVEAVLPELLEPLANLEGAMAGAAEATAALDQATSDLLGRIDQRQAWLNVVDSIEDYVRVLGDGESSARDQERAFLAAGEAILRYIADTAGIPEDIRTEITAAVNDGDIGRAYELLDGLERTRTAVVNIATGVISGALAGVLAGTSRTVRTDSAAPSQIVNNYAAPDISPLQLARTERDLIRVQGAG